ncbi:MAG: FecR family protein [Myxococcota bacterium]
MVGTIRALAAAAALLGVVSVAQAEQETIGRVLSVRGDVQIKQMEAAASTFLAVKRGDELQRGAEIKTGQGSGVRFLMRDRSILTLGPSTAMKIPEYQVDKKSRKRLRASLKLSVGRLWARVSSFFGADERNFEIRTANAVAGIRGTELIVDVASDGSTQITCVDGSVEVGGVEGGETQTIGALQRSTVSQDGGVSVEQVTAAQVQEMTDSLQLSTGLDPESADERLDATQPDAGGDTSPDGIPAGEEGSPESEDGELDDMGFEDDTPPLDLDPASGDARVRGTIRVED